MSNHGQGQINVYLGPDRPNGNQNRMLILGGVVVALLVIGLIFFLVRPDSNAPATATPTGQATFPAGNGHAGPAEGTTPGATPESTPAELPTATVSSPSGNAGPLDQQVSAALQAIPAVTTVRQNGPDILEIDFTIPQSSSLTEAGAAAKGQVRAILLALSVLPADLGRVTLSGFYDLPGEPNAVPVKLDYLSDVIKSTDWVTMSDEQLYAVSDVQAIKDEFK